MDTPSPLLVEFAGQLRPGRALDLACGSGRNALWLASRGWNVTAVDRSEKAVGELRDTVEAKVADLEKGQFSIKPDFWDLVVISHYLQRDLFEPVRNGLRTGGLAIVIVHLFEPGHESSRFSLHPGELANYFAGWIILHCREGKPVDHPQARAVAEIVARKPQVSGLRRSP